jgi:hypothetical protein
MNARVLGALIGGLAVAAPAVTPALAAGPASVATGQTMTFDVPSSPNGFSQTWTLNYPGDNSNLTVDAELGGYDPSFASAIGFNVFDSQHQSAPVEIATTQSNMKTNDPKGIEFNYSSGSAGPVSITNDPHGIEFVYSSGTPGTVIVQFWSYAPAALTMTLTQSGFIQSNPGAGNAPAITPVTLQG